jgi:hypothetical protein
MAARLRTHQSGIRGRIHKAVLIPRLWNPPHIISYLKPSKAINLVGKHYFNDGEIPDTKIYSTHNTLADSSLIWH